ncbi:MAG TPA: hypothetical protein VK806_14250 [Bacteroidia bacterium]|nr:hypothetical protein [Bacteroidia bacterium]
MKLRQKEVNSSLLKLFIPCLAIACCAIISSCNRKNNNTSDKSISLVQLLLGNGNSPFRNTALGTDINTVLKSEKKEPDEKDSNYLYYSMPMDTLFPDSVNATIDTLNYYTIAYNFTQQKLNEIDEYVYLATDSAASVLQQRLSDYLTTKYGEGNKGSDSKVWTFKKNGIKTNISLSNESEEYDYGKLSLVYYTED